MIEGPRPQESIRLSFQPFAVQCLTCSTRLRVTDPAIIGTIAACPKCNSMVQIERPAGQVAVGRPNVDSEAITEEAIDADGGTEVATDPSSGGFAGTETVEPAAMAPAVPPDWQSERTRRSRQLALVVTLSFSSLLIAVAVFGWFVRSWRLDATAAQAEVVSDVPSETSNLESNGLSETPSEALLVEEPEPDPPTANQQASVVAADDLPAVPAEPSAESIRPPAEAPTNESIPSDLFPQSPIVTMPDPIGSAEPNADETEATGMQELPPELRKYTQFLPDAGAIDAPTLQAPPTREEVKIDAAAEDGDDPLVPNEPKKLNLKADLAIELAWDSDGYPLSDLMLLVAQITGVPIQIDWVSFDLAGIDIAAQVPIRRDWHSARDLLEGTAAAMGGEIREEETLLVLTLTDATFEKTIASISDLQDFGTSRTAATSVLNEFLGGNPQAGQLHLGNTREEQQLAGLAIEALRRMRGIAPKVGDAPLRRWARSAENDAADWPLVSGGDTGVQGDTPITFAEFLRRMSRRNGATCVVNWYDANRQAAAPEHLVFPHVLGDAATTIGQTLAPFDLQVRSVDDGHWWVGTEATYDRLTAVVWTAPLGQSRDQFTRRINTIMDGAPPDIYRITIDPESDRALLLLPRYIVRQLPKIASSIAAK